MTYAKAVKYVESLGMSVSSDGVAFTVCGSQLVDGRDAPPEILRMNGWTVDEIARNALESSASHGD